jgi:putative ABC transport system ATP-binding protein
VFENITLAQKVVRKRSKADAKEKSNFLLKKVGIHDKSSAYPDNLSGGQQQRVAIARALVADPELLVCDEPTGDLDRDTADEILGLLEVLNRDHGKTIIMVTHDPKAADHAKQVLHMDKGSLLAAA